MDIIRKLGDLSPPPASGSREDGVVSVPSVTPVTPGVCSIVHMIRAGVGGGLGVGAVITVISKLRRRVWGGLVTVLFFLDLPGLS